MKTSESPEISAARDAAWRELFVPTITSTHTNCRYAPALAFVLAVNPHGAGTVKLHPEEVETFIRNAPFFSVSSVLVWEFEWSEVFPQDVSNPGPRWHTAHHLMHETNATALLSKWDGARHHYSVGYNGANGRVTWWENLTFATARNR